MSKRNKNDTLIINNFEYLIDKYLEDNPNLKAEDIIVICEHGKDCKGLFISTKGKWRHEK